MYSNICILIHYYQNNIGVFSLTQFYNGNIYAANLNCPTYNNQGYKSLITQGNGQVQGVR